MGGVVVAAGCFIAANFLPIGSGYWTNMSSGVQTAQDTLTFNLFHPSTRPIATGPDIAKVDVNSSLAPFLGIGTAVMLALAAYMAFLLLFRSVDLDLKNGVKGAYVLSLIWASMFAFIVVFTLATGVFKWSDTPGFYTRAVAQSGGWMLFAASAIVASTLRRTERHLRPPGTTQTIQRRSLPNNFLPGNRTPR